MIYRSQLIAAILGLVFVFGCGDAKKAEKKAEATKLPYMAIEYSTDTENDPAGNGPDDAEINAIDGGAGVVKFSHFKHASNGKDGYKIACTKCHHTAKTNDDVGEGCIDCHEGFDKNADVANYGPDDNFIMGDGKKITSVPFDHFTHASAKGYKLACKSCHHTEDYISCNTEGCHQEVAKTAGEGKVMLRAKRAYHLTCKKCHDSIKKNTPDTIAPTACKACHTDKAPKQMGGHLTANRAAHIQCIGCHEGVKKAKPNANAPTRKCTGCHAEIDINLPKAKAQPKAEAAPDVKPETEVKPEPTPAADADTGTGEAAAKDTGTGQDKGPENLVIDHAAKAKTGTPFPHWTHQELGEECSKCHHEGLDDPSCRNCHEGAKDAKKVYHKLCIACHKENGVGAGCADCHPKK